MSSWGHRAIRQVLDNLLGMGWKGRMRKLAVEMVGDGSIARACKQRPLATLFAHEWIGSGGWLGSPDDHQNRLATIRGAPIDPFITLTAKTTSTFFSCQSFGAPSAIC